MHEISAYFKPFSHCALMKHLIGSGMFFQKPEWMTLTAHTAQIITGNDFIVKVQYSFGVFPIFIHLIMYYKWSLHFLEHLMKGRAAAIMFNRARDKEPEILPIVFQANAVTV